MIKANELRIGNLVYSENSIYTIGGGDLLNLHKYYNSYSKSYNPILLTEEWLFRLGADVNKQIELNDNKHGSIDFSNFDDPYLVNSEFENFPLNKIQYVHQLQNLYFALTGQELELKTI
ncbi:MAG: hypothetical protein ACE5RP_06995 [Nitrosopumilus sp.]